MARWAGVVEDLANRWHELLEPVATSQVALLIVPTGWGRSYVLHEFAALIEHAEGPVTLLVQIGGETLTEDAGVQAKLLGDLLSQAASRNRAAELIGVDRFSGKVQLGLGVAGLFVSGLAAAIGFLLSSVAVGVASTAWNTSPTGQEGALARIARAVAAVSVSAPIVVTIDDADALNPALAATLIDNPLSAKLS